MAYLSSYRDHFTHRIPFLSLDMIVNFKLRSFRAQIIFRLGKDNVTKNKSIPFYERRLQSIQIIYIEFRLY